MIRVNRIDLRDTHLLSSSSLKIIRSTPENKLFQYIFRDLVGFYLEKHLHISPLWRENVYYSLPKYQDDTPTTTVSNLAKTL